MKFVLKISMAYFEDNFPNFYSLPYDERMLIMRSTLDSISKMVEGNKGNDADKFFVLFTSALNIDKKYMRIEPIAEQIDAIEFTPSEPSALVPSDYQLRLLT